MNSGERKAGYPNSPGYAQLPAGYGLNLAQLETLRQKQTRGEVELMPAIGQRKGYEIPTHDYLYVYHVSAQSPLYNRTGGHREDRGEVIQKYNVAAFKHMEKFGGFRGSEVEILHNPELAQQYVAEQTQKAQAAKATDPESEPTTGAIGATLPAEALAKATADADTTDAEIDGAEFSGGIDEKATKATKDAKDKPVIKTLK